MSGVYTESGVPIALAVAEDREKLRAGLNNKTLEEEVRQQRSDEIAAFVMPRPCRGQSVTWYSSGDRTCTGEMAFILEVGRRNLVLARASGTAIDSVRHIDDPKLKLSVEQRASGAWDFTERDKQLDVLQLTVADLKARIATLEEFINEPAKKPKTDKA